MATITQDSEKIPRPQDGIPAIKSTIYGPAGICIDNANNLLIVDQLHKCVRRVDGRTGMISTIAGTGTDKSSADNGPGKSASLQYPVDVEVDSFGNIYISDYIAGRIRRVDARTGIIKTVAGQDLPTWSDSSKDGDPALRRSIDRPEAVFFDGSGALYVVESSRLLRIDPRTRAMSTIVGMKDSRGFVGDFGPASSAKLNFPRSAAIDRAGNIFISDTDNYRLRRIDVATGRIATIYRAQQPSEERINGSLILRAGTYLGALIIKDQDLYFVESNFVKLMNLSSSLSDLTRSRSA